MSDIIIWNKIEKLKDLDKEMWFKSYPIAKEKTLVLINNSEVVFIEDLKVEGFTGSTDIEIVENYLKDREEKQKQQQEQAEKEKEKEQQKEVEIERKIEELETQYSLAIVELTEQIEKLKAGK
ncbi:hypothetical protein [Peptostreptococcus faecalis]|uniref:hypothetical protein n=1 Tax=Peptostreptococcus faecalis TaxID=2045015 RepID=UPI000C7BE1A9|nr:hypothetical protein [Peptostreptococcus faecalis]